MTKKEARKILGVTNETSRENIERRYGMYLKRYRMELEQAKMAAKQELADNQEESAVNAADAADAAEQGSAVIPDKAQRSLEYDFDQITQAYNVLMGYEVTVKEEPPSKVAPLLKKVGIDERKTKNFFFYYKYHILVGILLLITIAFTIRGCVNRVKPDFNIAFIGRFDYSSASDDLSERIKANVPEILEPGIDGAYIAEDNFGEQEYAMKMKATVLVMAGNIDVFIMDKACFERYAKQGAFVSLDEIAPRLGVNLEESKELILRVEDDSLEIEDGSAEKPDSAQMPQEEHLYGINVSDSTVMRQSGVIGDEMIASIYVGCEQVDKAEKLIQFLME
jgi:hypothetical protein